MTILITSKVWPKNCEIDRATAKALQKGDGLMGLTFQNRRLSIAGSDCGHLDKSAFAPFMLEEPSSRLVEDGAIKMLGGRSNRRSFEDADRRPPDPSPPILSSTTSLASPGFLANEMYRDHKETGLNAIGDCVKSARDLTNLGDTKPLDQESSCVWQLPTEHLVLPT